MLRLHQINARKLTDALVKINQQNKIDIVVFGGDLIDCGGKSFGSIQDGFKAFEDVVLKPLMQAIDLPNDHVIIVPGNHDKDVVNFKGKNLMEELKTESKVTKFLYSSGEPDENVRGMFPYFQFRDDFYKGYNAYSKSETNFSSRVTLDIDGKKIGIAMLNSAWGCTSKSGEYVLLGSAQVEEEVDEIQDCNVKIAVVHHDMSALMEYDRNAVKPLIMSNFDLLLTGHIHGDESNFIEIPSGDYIVRSGVAGITVSNNAETDENYKNGFHIIDVDVDNPRIIAMTK